MNHVRITVSIYHAPLWDSYSDSWYYCECESICFLADFAKLLFKKAMSDYYKFLDPTSQVRYVKKLSYLSLREAEGPYCNCDKFKNNMSKWPSVEFGHILCFYTECPGLYTRKELLQWKSLDGYNYFKVIM